MIFTRTITTKREYKPRYVIVGYWSGYQPSQRRLVHRVVVRNKAHADAVAALRSILYNDGTTLDLHIEELAYGAAKGGEIHGYDKLIEDCIFWEVNSVEALYNLKNPGPETSSTHGD